LDVEDGFQPCSSKHKSTLQPYLPSHISLRFVNNPSLDGIGPDKLLSTNIDASWRRGKKAKLDVEDGFQPRSPKQKATLRPYLHSHISLRFVNNPSSDGMLPDKLLSPNINASWRRESKFGRWGWIQTTYLQTWIYSMAILTQIHPLNIC